MQNNRRCLQSLLAQEGSAPSQDHLGTAMWLARTPMQPVLQGLGMVGLARASSSTSTSHRRRSSSHRPKRRRSAHVRPVSSGWVRSLRSHHPTTHRIRVPRLSLARASQMFFQEPQPISPSSRQPLPARGLRSQSPKTRGPETKGCDVHIVWECDWHRDTKTDPELCQFLNMLEIIEPLQLRDAFFGDCRNPVKLHHQVDEALARKSSTST